MHHEPSRQDSQPAHLYACHHVAHSSLIITSRSLAATARRAAARTPTRIPPHTRRLAPRSKSCVAVAPSRRNVQGAARSAALPRPCVTAHGQTPYRAVPHFDFSASSRRAWRLWAALGGSALPRGETGPLGAQPLPRVLEPAASKVADPTVSVSTRRRPCAEPTRQSWRVESEGGGAGAPSRGARCPSTGQPCSKAKKRPRACRRLGRNLRNLRAGRRANLGCVFLTGFVV